MYRRIGIGMSLGLALFVWLGVLFFIIAAFAQRPYYRERLGYGSDPIAVRTGMMAIALTPIIVTLGRKFNIITMITGINREHLNLLHRYVGYTYLVLSIVHTILFIVKPLHDGGAKALYEEFYQPDSYEVSSPTHSKLDGNSTQYTGIAPLTTLIFLCLFSVP